MNSDGKAAAPAGVFIVYFTNGDMKKKKGVSRPVNVQKAVPASIPEFQGNVLAVRTEKYWDMELQRIENILYEAAKAKVMDENTELSRKALDKAVKKQMTSLAESILNPVELKIRNTGRSNAAFHYMGSTFTFAEAMNKLEQ